jgi:hypothetical protein
MEYVAYCLCLQARLLSFLSQLGAITYESALNASPLCIAQVVHRDHR